MPRRRRKRKDLLKEIRSVAARERVAEIEFGIKEFVQGLLVGFIVGFLIATQLL